MKLLEENIGNILCDIGLSNLYIFFFNSSSQARETKAKINKWNQIQLKIICTVKEAISKKKRQVTEWEKILPNNMPDEA